MDCDEVMLLLATRGQRTLTGVEETRFHDHITDCPTCTTLSTEVADDDWRWLVRVPRTALDGLELGELPTVDPVVFVVKGEIAAGGMGKVTRVYDRRLGREVAVKELLDRDLHARFEREIQITARLQHPAIVSIYEAGRFPDGSSFYTMRLVPGRTLQDALDAASTLEERVRLMPYVRAAAEAIAFAHAHGVIHRDLKPANILVGEFGETVVIDWGLAKILDDDDDDDDVKRDVASPSPELTRLGTVVGTPCFMSPQQSAGEACDATDDVYALGAILYQVLAGSPPYWDTVPREPAALVAATVARAPTPIHALAKDAPPDLRAIVDHAMARTREDRYADAKALADDLARFDAGQLLASREYSARELFVRWIRRHRRSVALATLGLVAASLLGVVSLRYRRAEKELAIRERGARLTELYSDVARQAYRIDRTMLRLENALEGLAAAAAWALVGPEPTDDAAEVYFDRDFATQNLPPDYTKQTSYRWPVSIDFPVVSVPPGVEREPLLPAIRRLAPLRHHMRQMVLEAAVGDSTKITDAEARAKLHARASPIDYAYVDLPSGVHVVWPGMAHLRHDYDVRTASFYQMSRNRRGSRWGAPYVDATTDSAGDDLVLPCTKGIWSTTGEFLGVAGVEMTVTKLVDTSMTMQTRTVLRATLVDEKGRKVVDSFDADARFPSSGRDEALDLAAFELPAVVEAIGGEREGIIETSRDGRPIVAAFVRLDAIGWYYVVEIDAATLGQR